MCTCPSRDFPGNCHCTGCCRSFTGETAFRKHLDVEKGRVVAHNDPATVGLVVRADGRWGWPPPKGESPWRVRT